MSPALTAISSAMPEFTGRTIDNGRLLLTEMLGEGAYGVVYRAVEETAAHSSTQVPKEYAVKVLKKADVNSRVGEAQSREIVTHKIASEHPNVLTMHRVVEDERFYYLVLDYCPGGDLFGAIVERLIYCDNDALVKSVFVQILDAVQSCHDKGIFHRDLKPDNIFVNEDGTKAFLGDFGLATDAELSNAFGCGSSFYMSPECIGEEFNFAPYSTEASDIWALGIILTNMIAGRNPWNIATTDDEHFLNYMADPNYLKTMLPISDGANNILKNIFTYNPRARITIDELRDDILEVDTFFLTKKQLASATKATKFAAAAYTAPTPARPTSQRKSPKPSGNAGPTGIEEIDRLFAGNPGHPSPLPAVPLCMNLLTQEGIFTIGSATTSSSGEESAGPATPATYAFDPTGLGLEDISEFPSGISLGKLSMKEKERVSSSFQPLVEKLEQLAVL